MSQTLAKGTAPVEERGQILDSLVDRAHSLARLVQRFEAAVEAGLTEWADVTQVAREVAAMHDRVTVDAPAGPAMASLNRIAARRIVEELVENALAFSPASTLGHGPCVGGGRRPDVRVVDRGRGIEPAALDRIFEPLGARRGSQHPHTPGRRARTHAGTHVRPRHGRRRRPGVDRPGGLDVPVDGVGGNERRVAGPRYLKRRMCTLSKMPTATKFTSMAVPP